MYVLYMFSSSQFQCWKNDFYLFFLADVDGSLEALHTVIDSYNSDHQISLSVVSADVGGVTEKDLDLAETTKGTEILI